MRRVNKRTHLVIGERTRFKLLLLRLPNHFVLGFESQWGPEDASLPHEDGWVVFALHFGLWAVGLIYVRGNHHPSAKASVSD